MQSHSQIVDFIINFLEFIFSPGTLTIVLTIWGLLAKGFKILSDKVNKKQDEILEQLTERIDRVEQREIEFEKEISRDVIRQEFNYAIDSPEITEKELMAIYDRYKDAGGNSYADRRMDEYLRDDHARMIKEKKRRQDHYGRHQDHF